MIDFRDCLPQGRGEELRRAYPGLSALRERLFLRQDLRSNPDREREGHPRLPLRFKPGQWQCSSGRR